MTREEIEQVKAAAKAAFHPTTKKGWHDVETCDGLLTVEYDAVHAYFPHFKYRLEATGLIERERLQSLELV